MVSRTEWICRVPCYWADRMWNSGDKFTPDAKGIKFVLSGDFWHPIDAKVLKPGDMLFIPVHFEPMDFDVLSDPRDILKARSRASNPAKWKHHEDDLKELDELPLPEPLTSEDLAKLDMDPNALMSVKLKPKKEEEKPPVPVKKGPFGREIKPM